MRTTILLENLRTRGSEAEFVPMVESHVADFFTIEDGQLVRWHYLIPQFELTEEYKQTMRELDEMSLQRELRRDHEG